MYQGTEWLKTDDSRWHWSLSKSCQSVHEIKNITAVAIREGLPLHVCRRCRTAYERQLVKTEAVNL